MEFIAELLVASKQWDFVNLNITQCTDSAQYDLKRQQATRQY